MEEEHVVPQRDHVDSDPPIHKYMPTPPDLAEKPATPPEAEEPAAAQTCDTSVVPKMVRAYEKAATP
jgi:hypothetical protein